MTTCVRHLPCHLNLALACRQRTSTDLETSTPAPGRAMPCMNRPSPRSEELLHIFNDEAFGKKAVLVPRSPTTVSPAPDTVLAIANKKQNKAQPPVSGGCRKRVRRSNCSGVSVRFSSCTKVHDGPRPSSQCLDAVVFAYFQTQCISTANDIECLIKQEFSNQKFETTVLNSVLNKLTALCQRVSQLKAFTSMPVLIEGGGRGLQLQNIHLPHLLRLASIFQHFVTGLSK